MPFTKGNKINLGRKQSEEHKNKVRLVNLGKKLSEITKKKVSIAMMGNNHGKGNRGRIGDKAPNWKGGVTAKHQLIRSTVEYKLWRKSVMERDNWTCVWCGYRSKGNRDIHTDHIKPFALFPKIRFAIDNGRTLCVECHKTTHSYMNNKTAKNTYQEAT